MGSKTSLGLWLRLKPVVVFQAGDQTSLFGKVSKDRWLHMLLSQDLSCLGMGSPWIQQWQRMGFPVAACVFVAVVV